GGVAGRVDAPVQVGRDGQAQRISHERSLSHGPAGAPPFLRAAGSIPCLFYPRESPLASGLSCAGEVTLPGARRLWYITQQELSGGRRRPVRAGRARFGRIEPCRPSKNVSSISCARTSASAKNRSRAAPPSRKTWAPTPSTLSSW